MSASMKSLGLQSCPFLSHPWKSMRVRLGSLASRPAGSTVSTSPAGGAMNTPPTLVGAALGFNSKLVVLRSTTSLKYLQEARSSALSSFGTKATISSCCSGASSVARGQASWACMAEVSGQSFGAYKAMVCMETAPSQGKQKIGYN